MITTSEMKFFVKDKNDKEIKEYLDEFIKSAMILGKISYDYNIYGDFVKVKFTLEDTPENDSRLVKAYLKLPIDCTDSYKLERANYKLTFEKTFPQKRNMYSYTW